jgi:hypothetical protein
MGNYYCIHILQLKPTISGTNLEALIRIRVIEMERWIPGIQRCSLLRINANDDEPIRYMMTLTFATHEAYGYWRQVEEEAPAYWPQLASVLLRCEQSYALLEEYKGTMVLQEILNSDV